MQQLSEVKQPIGAILHQWAEVLGELSGGHHKAVSGVFCDLCGIYAGGCILVTNIEGPISFIFVVVSGNAVDRLYIQAVGTILTGNQL